MTLRLQTLGQSDKSASFTLHTGLQGLVTWDPPRLGGGEGCFIVMETGESWLGRLG